MANKSYMSETKEAAYLTWRKCGQNVELTLRELAKQGWTLTKPTIYEWMEKFGWKDRAALAEAAERKAADAVLSAEARAIVSLEKIRSRYEEYFDTLKPGDRVDTNEVHAYKGVIMAINDIKAKTGAQKASFFLDFMRELIDWLGRNDPESVDAIEKNFDEFVAYAKEKYAA